MNLRVGVIGMGVISKYYFEALNKSDMLLVAVCDLKEEKLIPYQNKGISVYTDYKIFLERSDIDAVIINVPNDLHYAICRDSLMAGKHVCCEKPLTMSITDAETLVRLSHITHRTLFTAFHRRYNQHFKQMVKRLPSLGQIADVRIRYLEKIEEHAGDDQWYLQPERCGGGCIADNGPNVYDTLTAFLGKLNVLSVDIDYDSVTNIDMAARVQLISDTDISASVELDWAYKLGEKKDILIKLKNGQELYMDMLEGFAVFKSSLFHEYSEILSDFEENIKEGQCHGEDGLDAVRLVHETYQLAQYSNRLQTCR